VILEPLAAGVVGIPAIEVRGQRTAALTLSVLTASAVRATPGADLLLEVEVSPEQPYVQQQLIYTVRLLYAVTLLDGQLDEPLADGADIRRLGGDATYTRETEGRRYSVIERRYALTPLASGALEILAPRFRGRALAGPRGGRMFDPGSPVSAVGDALSLQVRPRPAAAAQPWLPALALDYSLQSGASDVLKVGEPITLSLRLSARGLSAEQLPELSLPEIEGAEIYPDQETSQTREGPRGIEGERSRSFAVVPTRPGQLRIPELSIDWWDTTADQAASARIAARSFSVEGSPRPTDTPDPSRGDASAPPLQGEASEPPRDGVDARWRIAALLLLALWLLSLAGWAWQARRRPLSSASTAAAPMPPRAGPELAQALRRGDLEAIADALRALARARDLAPSLDALAAALQAAPQRSAVLGLQRALYAGGSGADSLQALRIAFAKPPIFLEAGSAVAESLPPLYPPR
jgi:hypothetical protein